jgi:hypothetical protein
LTICRPRSLRTAGAISFMTYVLQRLEHSEAARNESILVLLDTADAAQKAQQISRFLFPSLPRLSWDDATNVVNDTHSTFASTNASRDLMWKRRQHTNSSCASLLQHFSESTIIGMSRRICSARSPAILTQFAMCHELEMRKGEDSVCRRRMRQRNVVFHGG